MSDEEQLAKKILPILHRYKYGYSMLSGKSLSLTDGHKESLEISALFQPTHQAEAKPSESATFKTREIDGIKPSQDLDVFLDEQVLDIAVQASLYPRGKTINADMFPAKARIAAHFQAAVRNNKEDILHRVADVLSWHVSQGNIEMKHRSVEQIMQQYQVTQGLQVGILN